uniref:Aminoglycoside phosphotransferase domain-containing protein n=1 Tax=Chaetoceros debilis TaxID=122233 RepID=A0A7S3QJV6_9STRA|mmetsp:Transcript_28019/g.42942  ORF Transcript_28019/g.42942 Transcript_28019/m.42942 type:complete len:438 (-) Transcript_28019:21-1334(-)
MKGIVRGLFSLFSMNSNINLLPSLQRIDESICSYSTSAHIVQGSAEGFIIEAQRNGDSQPRHLFVKYVDVPKYGQKSWPDLRRTIHYCRTEVRFYNEILPLLRDGLEEEWVIAPEIYLAEYDVQGLMNEDESTAAKKADDVEQHPQYDESDMSVLHGKYGIIIMDNVVEINKCYQKAPLRESIAIASVEGLARFHASAFGNNVILGKVEERLCQYGGSYHLKNRNPLELKNLVKAWDEFIINIGPVNKEVFGMPSIKALGQRLFDMAEFVSEELSPAPTSSCATIVHGDYKAMNVFFTDNENGDTSTILIDFASTGVGLGMSDLAMHVANVALAEDLDNGMEEVLFERYYAALPKIIQDVYSVAAARRHYQYATVDFCRYILGRMWKGATVATFEQRNKNPNWAMINRSPEAAIKLIVRTDKYLKLIEEEKDAAQKV